MIADQTEIDLPGVKPLEDARAFIPLSTPSIKGNEWSYVKQCLDTGWVSSAGAFVQRFEREFAARVGRAHAVAMANGTSALHLALLVAGVKPDTEVLVSTLTFIAPVNAVRYVGAWPAFVDADESNWQIDPDRVRWFLEHRCVTRGGRLFNRATGRRISAILPVHILGHAVDIHPILDLAARYGLPVIEDACESLGATIDQRSVGSFGELGCFSFNGNKLMTTGGGGMLVTDDAALAEQARYLSTQAKTDPTEYVHNEIGYNYRLTNMLAAVGVAQLERLDDFVAAKRAIAQRYERDLVAIPGIQPMPRQIRAESAFWMYTVLVDSQQFGCSSRKLMSRLAARRIETRPLWQPIHRSHAHDQAAKVRCPVADHLFAAALSLPCSVDLLPADQDRVVREIKEIQQDNLSSPSEMAAC